MLKYKYTPLYSLTPFSLESIAQTKNGKIVGKNYHYITNYHSDLESCVKGEYIERFNSWRRYKQTLPSKFRDGYKDDKKVLDFDGVYKDFDITIQWYLYDEDKGAYSFRILLKKKTMIKFYGEVKEMEISYLMYNSLLDEYIIRYRGVEYDKKNFIGLYLELRSQFTAYKHIDVNRIINFNGNEINIKTDNHNTNINSSNEINELINKIDGMIEEKINNVIEKQDNINDFIRMIVNNTDNYRTNNITLEIDIFSIRSNFVGYIVNLVDNEVEILYNRETKELIPIKSYEKTIQMNLEYFDERNKNRVIRDLSKYIAQNIDKKKIMMLIILGVI